ncbi:MAG: hypothetical protein A3H57_02740 [Candidatus Taylorbacteria bacterium RIFCSPLOWO2_02_FULL_43_11]|uniref:Uncharacterized protein n=1 Tax=Candidatus Taylorbacteria bacterium RIFCSPHIGHO2_02_FULL_43_32b TaxID=1802306 RepID=A0A1G2MH69_9BACT|nr:MAG: hypothetical protein A2743_01105 [Candidatus Taylorbacteria bacterium RIFCSPHIGHO2_01_FULL_43_47]OHA22342.1 MAG: hypothetical protein A3C72_04660 [Candidatus Taylorbacteria bacterium RIFCSPHIGHO2_02_FULL_43_32b]OHA29072.1 MAG: hypothetical protein A3B08_02875 [Candidatus Taylorbacteria bacterium RIFCSPLOWO2_01_FULL_43_44]OHA36349.1 MAG: hypothetical protein A3H57_02740 [Candidatus Taylorbacteria bacterium RIFCSPLOWO2_02_FULL_43_11]
MSEKRCSTLPPDISGLSFCIQGGETFKVLRGQYFSDQNISGQHRRYLGGLREGLLVSVSFYGQPVPLITVKGGVVRLIEIEIDSTLFKGSHEISQKLKVTKTRFPIALFQG